MVCLGTRFKFLKVANDFKPRISMAMTIQRTKLILMTSLIWELTIIGIVVQMRRNLMKMSTSGLMRRMRLHGNTMS